MRVIEWDFIRTGVLIRSQRDARTFSVHREEVM